ncbi:hypothetical protein BS50DRAFT_632804 [Corynespora cassiicola Philippines]|uniref:Uncharacterized protein n=1 Tax=Corynespora cassiicola Philippines TaxID=1448308 RepID=A0A2T2NU56_CORCC|nr:hypothetical protein BS50DRAFT_632804 [Corynespora cassiicola Philippines]
MTAASNDFIIHLKVYDSITNGTRIFGPFHPAVDDDVQLLLNTWRKLLDPFPEAKTTFDQYIKDERPSLDRLNGYQANINDKYIVRFQIEMEKRAPVAEKLLTMQRGATEIFSVRQIELSPAIKLPKSGRTDKIAAALKEAAGPNGLPGDRVTVYGTYMSIQRAMYAARQALGLGPVEVHPAVTCPCRINGVIFGWRLGMKDGEIVFKNLVTVTELVVSKSTRKDATLCIKASYAPHSKDCLPNNPPKTIATSNIDITPKTWTMIYPRHFICTFSWTPYTETFGPFGYSPKETQRALTFLLNLLADFHAISPLLPSQLEDLSHHPFAIPISPTWTGILYVDFVEEARYTGGEVVWALDDERREPLPGLVWMVRAWTPHFPVWTDGERMVSELAGHDYKRLTPAREMRIVGTYVNKHQAKKVVREIVAGVMGQEGYRFQWDVSRAIGNGVDGVALSKIKEAVDMVVTVIEVDMQTRYVF